MKDHHSHKVHKTDIKQEKKATDHNITWVMLIVSFNSQCVSPSQSSFSEMFQKKTPTEKKKKLEVQLLSIKTFGNFC